MSTDEPAGGDKPPGAEPAAMPPLPAPGTARSLGLSLVVLVVLAAPALAQAPSYDDCPNPGDPACPADPGNGTARGGDVPEEAVGAPTAGWMLVAFVGAVALVGAVAWAFRRRHAGP